MTLDITVGADVRGLETLLSRLIPGSNVRVEMAGRSIVLIGTVRTPINSNRATDIARAFAASNSGEFVNDGGGQPQSGIAQGGTTIINSSDKSSSGDGQASSEQAKAVINLLGVEGEEQVMLRVVVAEVQRELLKQFGVNLAADINAGNFSLEPAHGQRLAAYHRRRSRRASDPRCEHDRRPEQRLRRRHMLLQ